MAEERLDDDLTVDVAGLLTEDIDDLEPVRVLPRLEDLVAGLAVEVLDETPFLLLVMDELLTPALLDEEPIPLLPLEPVVVRRGV